MDTDFSAASVTGPDFGLEADVSAAEDSLLELTHLGRSEADIAQAEVFARLEPEKYSPEARAKARAAWERALAQPVICTGTV